MGTRSFHMHCEGGRIHLCDMTCPVIEHGLVEVLEKAWDRGRERDHAESAGEGFAVDGAVEPEPAATGPGRDPRHPLAYITDEHLLPLSPGRV